MGSALVQLVTLVAAVKPSCTGHSSGAVSAPGRYLAVTISPGPPVWGVTADLNPEKDLLVLLCWRLTLHPPGSFNTLEQKENNLKPEQHQGTVNSLQVIFRLLRFSSFLASRKTFKEKRTREKQMK